MATFGGPADWWTDGTDAGRKHIATKGIVQNGLVLNLDAGVSDSYPGSGNTWTDLSGNGNNGTLTNMSATPLDSANGGSLVFDGVNDYVSFASNPSLTNQITVEVWVKMNSTTPEGQGWILGRERCYRMTYLSYGFAWVCSTTNNGWYTPGTSVFAGSTTPYTETYQVVATYNGSNNRIYVNGELKNVSANISGNILTHSSNNYFLIKTGAFNIDQGKGNIYSHKLYNRALTQQEILQNFNATRGRFGI